VSRSDAVDCVRTHTFTSSSLAEARVRERHGGYHA
jgi:hypothetical protein